MNPRSTSAPCEPFVLPRLLGATPPRSRLCLWPYSLRSATPRPRDDAAAGIRCARPARRWHSGGLQTFALTQPSRRERLSAARLGCATTTCCATTAGPPVSRVTSAATPQTSSAKFGDETGRGADEHGREPDRRSRSGPAIELQTAQVLRTMFAGGKGLCVARRPRSLPRGCENAQPGAPSLSAKGERSTVTTIALPFALRSERFQRRAALASPAASNPCARVPSSPTEAGCGMLSLGAERRLHCNAQARWART